MNPLADLIAAGESQTLEFKASFDKVSIETLVAFANAQGGTVLIGVADSGRVQGITLGKESLNEWLVQIKSATSPSIIPDLPVHHVDGKSVVAIDIAEFPVKPVSTKGRYYKRVVNTNFGKLTVADVQADNYRSSLRNKLVAEGFYLTHAIEKYGSGFIRIRKALLDYPEIEFAVEEKFGGVVASFTQLESRSDPVDGGVSGGVSGGVNSTSTLLTIMRTRPGLNAAALVQLSGKPQRTIERWLKQLRNVGQIQFIGSPKTGGYFLLEQQE